MKHKLGFLLTSSITTFYLLLAIGVSHLILVILIPVFGISSINYLIWNPITKGFIHRDIEHLTYNLSIIFFLLLFPINRYYNFSKLFLIAFVLSLFGIFLDLITNEPSAGISCILYFLLSRAFMSSRRWWGYLLLGLILYPEVFFISNFTDEISQHNHLNGAFWGILSMRNESKLPINILKPKNQIEL